MLDLCVGLLYRLASRYGTEGAWRSNYQNQGDGLKSQGRYASFHYSPMFALPVDSLTFPVPRIWICFDCSAFPTLDLFLSLTIFFCSFLIIFLFLSQFCSDSSAKSFDYSFSLFYLHIFFFISTHFLSLFLFFSNDIFSQCAIEIKHPLFLFSI